MTLPNPLLCVRLESGECHGEGPVSGHLGSRHKWSVSASAQAHPDVGHSTNAPANDDAR